MLMKYHVGDSAEMDTNYSSGGQVLRTPRRAALKIFPVKLFWSDRNNNLKCVILGT